MKYSCLVIFIEVKYSDLMYYKKLDSLIWYLLEPKKDLKGSVKLQSKQILIKNSVKVENRYYFMFSLRHFELIE
jgi:hypothetical protein